jgi:hypothetical protein
MGGFFYDTSDTCGKTSDLYAMKKTLIFFLLLFFCIAIWFGESREFLYFKNGKCITTWKTYNNQCYVIIGRYYGLFKPSVENTYIKTSNTSSGIDLIWKSGTDTVLVQMDDSDTLFNSTSNKVVLSNYDLNRKYNDSLYTYFDPKLKIERYKETTDLISVAINKMGAL